MTSTDRAGVFANSVWLTLAARLSMAAFVPLIVVGWLYIDGRFTAIASSADTAVATASNASEAAVALQVRMAVVENNQTNGRSQRDAQFLALTNLIADLQRTQTSTLQAVAALAATVDAMKERQ